MRPPAPPPAVEPMPAISAAIVGTESPAFVHDIDARWLMAYAAAAGARDPDCFDTARPRGPRVHALFAVCYEWPAVLDLRERTLDAAVRDRGVHTTHRLLVHRAPRAGDRLTTTGRVVAVTRRRAGTTVTIRLVTLDARRHPVTTTEYTSLYRGVTGDATVPEADAQAEPRDQPSAHVTEGAGATWTETIEVPARAAHVYTECARIWNPIHTDVAVARAAGLPGPILHGTATLALCLSAVTARELPGEEPPVREIAARFTGMVPVPSAFTVRATREAPRAVRFEAIGAGGARVLSEGVLLT